MYVTTIEVASQKPYTSHKSYLNLNEENLTEMNEMTDKNQRNYATLKPQKICKTKRYLAKSLTVKQETIRLC